MKISASGVVRLPMYCAVSIKNFGSGMSHIRIISEARKPKIGGENMRFNVASVNIFL